MLELGRLVHRDAVARVRDVPAFDHRAADEQHTHNEEHDARRELAQPHGKRKREHDHARTESKNEHQGPEHGASEKSKRMWARTSTQPITNCTADGAKERGRAALGGLRPKW